MAARFWRIQTHFIPSFSLINGAWIAISFGKSLFLNGFLCLRFLIVGLSRFFRRKDPPMVVIQCYTVVSHNIRYKNMHAFVTNDGKDSGNQGVTVISPNHKIRPR